MCKLDLTKDNQRVSKEKKDTNDLILAVIIILIIGIPLFSLIHFIETHTEKLIHDNWIKGASPCAFLKDFVSEEKQYSYPLFYDGTARKINSVECLEELK